MRYEVCGADCGYETKKVLQNISLEVCSGDILCLLGPNGVGKTTLFKSMMGFLPLLGGSIRLDGEDILKWSRRRMAQAIGYVPQSHTPPFPFTVIDVVVMGRISHLGLTASPDKEDYQIAEQNLERLNIAFLRDCIYTEISGGERQMVLIARALSQNPKLLIMDEPTANLDFSNQVQVLSQIEQLAREGIAVIMTSHFPDHAFLCSTKVGLLQRNSVLKIGRADEIVTEKNLKEAYGIDVRIIEQEDPVQGQLRSCVPLMNRSNIIQGG